MELRVLSADDLQRALPMPACIECMRSVFAEFSRGNTIMPARAHIDTPRGTVLVMPSYLTQSGDCAVKIVSVYGDNPRQGLRMINGLVVVLNVQTGLPCALLDANTLTAIRTGAAGGVAADLLARRDASTVALFGAGDQARTQLEALLVVRPIQRVLLLSRSRASAEKFATEVGNWPSAPTVEIFTDPAAAIAQADVVITATTAEQPLFDGRQLKPGTHVTAVGSFQPHVRELDEVTVQQARVVVDSRAAALAEAGDLIQAGLDASGGDAVVELGEVITNPALGRRDNEQLTVFKSVGLAVQDAAAAACALQTAANEDYGTIVQL